jgi:hypothetical protein
MKIKQIITLIVGMTTVAFSPITGAAGRADTDQEQALLYSGFKVKSASTAGQRAQVRALSTNEFTAVKQNLLPVPRPKK